MNPSNEKFQDTKGVIRSHQLKQDIRYNGQTKRTKERTYNDLQNIIQKTKDRGTWITLKPSTELWSFCRVISSCSINGSSHMTIIKICDLYFTPLGKCDHIFIYFRWSAFDSIILYSYSLTNVYKIKNIIHIKLFLCGNRSLT